ncbi:beta strand repeat-containing protein [Salinisphaera hydrothermalis]|uniref:beta strand repeat-containing protein n=1 Tax=Salinisphaera hydrothermalis TaxID=563188 RepID=UPI00333E5906
MKHSITPLVAATLCAATVTLASPAVLADSFTIDPGQTLTTPQTLTDGQSGTIKNGGALVLPSSSDSVGITVSGQTTIDNAGTIDQQGSGRAIRNDGSDLTLSVVNQAGALLQSKDADVIQLHKGNNVTFDNYGTVNSQNISQGGAQAIDFNHVTQGNNTVNNHAGGTITAFDADAVRPGVDGVVINEGTIKSTNPANSTDGSDGIDAQDNSGVTVVNHPNGKAATSLIEGARHGITGGNTDTSTNGDYAMRVTNNKGGTIQGDDGSGINIDGFNGNEKVTVVNHGLISGDGVTGDGDGVDVDGLVDINNTGTIVSRNAYQETSEGVTVGGGKIVNSGTISGQNSSGLSHGITLAGLDKNPDTDQPIPVEGIFADSSVINSGLIEGQTGAGIAVTGAANSHTVTIDNRAGGTIEGGGSEAAVFTGGNAATVTNRGTIIANGSGKAVDLGSGDSTLRIRGGQARIDGDISGGTGNSTLSITPGAGQQFAYAGNATHFNHVNIGAGTTVLNGQNTNIGSTGIADGTLIVGDQAGDGANLAGDITAKAGATLAGHGTVGATTIAKKAILSPGNGTGDVGTLGVQGPLNLNGSLYLDIASQSSTDQVNVNGVADFGSGSLLGLNLLADNNLKVGDTLDVMMAQSFENLSNLGLDGLNFGAGWQFDVADVGLSNSPGRALQLTVKSVGRPVPEPSGLGLLAVGLGLIGVFKWRIQRRGRPALG